MNLKHPFKWRHFQSDIILLWVRWYLRYPLSYCNLASIFGIKERPLNPVTNDIDASSEFGLQLQLRSQALTGPICRT